MLISSLPIIQLILNELRQLNLPLAISLSYLRNSNKHYFN